MLLFCKTHESSSVAQRKQEAVEKLTRDVLVYRAVPSLNVTCVNVPTSVVLTRILPFGQAGPHIRLGEMLWPHLVTAFLFVRKQVG